MLITLIDANTIRLSFPYYAPTVAALKTMLGAQYEEATKTWRLPLYHLRSVIEQWPGARLEEGVVDARLDMWARWMRQHNAMGVWFAYAPDGQTVIAMGQGISPAFQDWVKAHSGLLWRFLGDQHSISVSSAQHQQIEVEPSKADELIWSGIQNARQAEERRAVYQKPKRRLIGDANCESRNY
jgi:hypothetical protein